MNDSSCVKESERTLNMILKTVNFAATNAMDTNNENYSSSGRVKIYLAHGIILSAIFALSVYKATKDKVTTTLTAISIFIVIFVICNLILCLCEVLVWFIHANSWSGEDLTSMLSRHFVPNTASVVIIACATLLLLGQIIILQKCPLHYIWSYGPYVSILSMIFSFLLLRSVTSEWKINKSAVFSFSNLKGLDYGTGMAYSYYYGYLRLILPSTGTTSKGIVEKIENYEAKHNITFPVHKLFILIPSSGYIPPDLKEASDQWMESAQVLEEEIRNRAGVVGRTYRNNAYKIYPGGRESGANPIYVVVEGATPLLTFYEVQRHDHAETLTYKQFSHEIIATFHMKLHNALQNELDTKDLCELIYYDDYKSDGTKINIAKIILKRIFELRRFT